MAIAHGRERLIDQDRASLDNAWPISSQSSEFTRGLKGTARGAQTRLMNPKMAQHSCLATRYFRNFEWLGALCAEQRQLGQLLAEARQKRLSQKVLEMLFLERPSAMHISTVVYRTNQIHHGIVAESKKLDARRVCSQNDPASHILARLLTNGDQDSILNT